MRAAAQQLVDLSSMLRKSTQCSFRCVGSRGLAMNHDVGRKGGLARGDFAVAAAAGTKRAPFRFVPARLAQHI